MSNETKALWQAAGLDVGWVFLAPWFVVLAAGDLHRQFTPVPLCAFHHRGAGGAHTASHSDWEAGNYILGLITKG